ncbi:fimbrial protein [Erwinia sp. V90_4]|uniref:fimbrial protein n=1 Tax=Erwinia TaxID=551 RepID=UPI00249F4DC9|nr:fimbrial protein [Erwinia sp. V90_4]MDI3440672.1 fimbrial protein [Erwinia sp. V90_4]
MSNKQTTAKRCALRFYQSIPIISGLAIAAVQANVPHRMVDGNNGWLTISGSLTENACRLEMRSLDQTVTMGNTGSAELQYPGDRATPVTFQLTLEDCVSGLGAQRDTRTGNLTWSTLQPSVSVWFYGARDNDMPNYLQVSGTHGLALALADAKGRPLPLNQRATPLLLTPGRNTLTYTVTPVRTPSPLRVGAWHASLNFRMIYD